MRAGFAQVTDGFAGQPGVLPVLPALAGLLPGDGLARGAVVAVERPGLLCLALAAGASRAGAWCGVAGLPELGVVAAAGTGVNPGRLMLVPRPGRRWAEVTAELLEGCEVVVTRLPGPPPAPVRRRPEAVARQRGGVLIAAGQLWEGALVRLRVTRRSWAGIGNGYGRVRACRAEVTAEGRGAAARVRSCWLWLPGPDGAVTAAEPAGVTAGEHGGRAQAG